MRIYLIGFMGSGKTFTGQKLAAGLGFGFLDLDEWIEEKEGKTIAGIFEEQGETVFRELEAATLRQTTQFSRTIISTGGGAPCYHYNMDWMNGAGVTIFLNASIPVLASRLEKEVAKRPVLEGRQGQELEAFIEGLLAARNPFYEQAHISCEIFSKKFDPTPELVEFLKRFVNR